VLYSRVLVGTDGSPTAGRAVERAAAVAASTKTPLVIVSVAARSHPAVTASVEELLAKEAARYAGLGVPVTTELHVGDPASALVEAAEAEADTLLVVGNKGMTGAARFLLGSVPNKISHQAHCNLLIVHTT
jgi:nucleotide-binding universal stress UspA family protein